jgi:DNA polymerase I-like protein with 3'-5' exonuclease and polymerase domains
LRRNYGGNIPGARPRLSATGGIEQVKNAFSYLDQNYVDSRLDTHIILTIHDEVIVEAKAEDVDYVKDLMEDCLTQAFKGVMREMPFTIQARIADSGGS